MTANTPLSREQRPANLEALRRDLERLMARVQSRKQPTSAATPELRAPVLVIRGK